MKNIILALVFLLVSSVSYASWDFLGTDDTVTIRIILVVIMLIVGPIIYFVEKRKNDIKNDMA